MSSTGRPGTSDLDVKIIRYWLERGHGVDRISRMTDFSEATVRNVRSGAIGSSVKQVPFRH